SPTHALRRARLARDVLHDRNGALADERDGHRMGAHAVAREAAGGVGSVESKEYDGEMTSDTKTPFARRKMEEAQFFHWKVVNAGESASTEQPEACQYYSHLFCC